MKINFNNNTIIDCGTLLSSPADAPLEFVGAGNHIERVDTIFRLHHGVDPEDLGLSEATPADQLDDLITGIVAIRDEPLESKKALIDDSGIAAWLKSGVGFADLMSKIIALCEKIPE